MSDISKINVDGVDYDLKDATARSTVTSHSVTHKYGESDPVSLWDISYFGREPVSVTTNDTPSIWKTFGCGFAYYASETFSLNNQPSKYGFLIQYVNNSDLVQIWMDLANGAIYYRMGNAVGWWASSNDNGTWRKLYDSSNIPLPKVTTSDNGKVLKVVNGVWTAVAG